MFDGLLEDLFLAYQNLIQCTISELNSEVSTAVSVESFISKQIWTHFFRNATTSTSVCHLMLSGSLLNRWFVTVLIAKTGSLTLKLKTDLIHTNDTRTHMLNDYRKYWIFFVKWAFVTVQYTLLGFIIILGLKAII